MFYLSLESSIFILALYSDVISTLRADIAFMGSFRFNLSQKAYVMVYVMVRFRGYCQLSFSIYANLHF